ncbi:MAG: dimethylsulfoniopropionate lyase [Bacteroidales bacterium]|nr:dimethylsulfoniopropionate lyase [Bacteroidales bacterium]MCF8338395.1 dimethylsulfoniopropionate lyase [Bacteroidales bacterium]
MQNTQIDVINWHELLREVETIFLSKQNQDSSTAKHIAQILKNIEYLRGDFKVQSRQPQMKQVNYEYPLSSFINFTSDFAPLINVLNQISDLLHWEQDYKNLPAELSDNFAFCNLMGHKGHVFNDNMRIGVLVLGPHTYYPKHKHEDIQELYICLSGEISINGKAVSEAETSLIDTSEAHDLKTGENPCLLLYSWLGNKQKLAANGMRFV